MKRSMLIALSVVGVVGAGTLGASGAFGAGPTSAPSAGGTPGASISSAVASELTFVREEERLARDLYAAIAKQYDGAAPFSMITNAEQRHFDAVGTLLVRNGIADPSTGSTPGVYADATLQKLYDGWLARSKSSLTEAYRVGADLEKQDIADLDKAIADNAPADVDRVLANLKTASEHHLAMFDGYASGTPVTHTPMDGQRGAGQGMGGGMGGHGMGGGMGGRGYGHP